MSTWNEGLAKDYQDMDRESRGPEMSAHTPGPWYQTASDPAGICVYAENGGAHSRIAVIDAKGVNGAGAANARLIAAAPALLEALDILVRAVNVKELDPLVVFASIEQARSAIRAAKGETK